MPVAQGGKTGTVRVCGKPSEHCLTDPGDPVRCDTTPLICEPEDARQEVEDIEFLDGAPTPPCPSELFQNPPEPEPDLTLEYPRWDEPCAPFDCAGPDGSGGPGQNHPYCKYAPTQDGEVVNAISPEHNHARAKNKNKTGSPSIIDFEFDPRLDLEYRAKLGPFGVPDVFVRAGAGLVAKAEFHGGPIPFSDTVELVNLTARAQADRCTVTTDGSAIRIFGHNFLPSSASLDVEVPGCEEAFANFETRADRASKAMRDAASLLKQYESAQAAGKRLDLSSLCALGGVLDDPPADFPLPMNCADQPPESHLNELIDYYEQQVLALKAAGRALGEALTVSDSKDVFKRDDSKGDEEQTLFVANFLVGPIPVTLEAFIAAHYDIGLSVGYRLKAGAAVAALLSGATGQDHELLAVFVNGGPSATALLGFFGGVGFSVGPASASVGIEARLTLGQLGLTVEGGSGLFMTGRPDPRPLGLDLASLVLPGSEPLIDPLVYELKLGYSAGLRADIRKILSGDINGRLRLKFFWFSKTFRQRLLKFDGFCTNPADLDDLPCRIPILTLGGAETLGKLPWASVRMSQVLPKLKYLPFVPEPDPMNAPPAEPVDLSDVEELFYDRLCSCVAEGNACHSDGDCCDGLPCADDGTGTTSCGCRPAGQTCAADDDCCSGQPCVGGVCQCTAERGVCSADGECCAGEGPCIPVPGGGRCGCSGIGSACALNTDCCAVDQTTCCSGSCGHCPG